MGTVQFAGAVHESCAQLVDHFDTVAVPQAKPLSPGEVLGCTAPVIEGKDALVFVADGRFHLEVSFGTSAIRVCVCPIYSAKAWLKLVNIGTVSVARSARGSRSCGQKRVEKFQ